MAAFCSRVSSPELLPGAFSFYIMWWWSLSSVWLTDVSVLLLLFVQRTRHCDRQRRDPPAGLHTLTSSFLRLPWSRGKGTWPALLWWDAFPQTWGKPGSQSRVHANGGIAFTRSCGRGSAQGCQTERCLHDGAGRHWLHYGSSERGSFPAGDPPLFSHTCPFCLFKEPAVEFMTL